MGMILLAATRLLLVLIHTIITHCERMRDKEVCLNCAQKFLLDGQLDQKVS